jgi:hypothetical protein
LTYSYADALNTNAVPETTSAGSEGGLSRADKIGIGVGVAGGVITIIGIGVTVLIAKGVIH